ncbi:MAG: DUF4384 domain-containing protein [Pseudomonadota bacterium]
MSQPAGTQGLQTIEDGAVLRDGGSDPALGDLIKAYFRVNCACYVYVIGVDATGYVAQIFPDTQTGQANPVVADAEYILPEAAGDWWALDTYKGIEQVFFVASYVQRSDIEEVLGRLANLPRQVQPQSFQPVVEPALVPATRGLVRVKTAAVQVTSTAGDFAITPEMFKGADGEGSVVVTRWFNHE